ncbi:FtsB family cell division protein, partial [Streptomyces sp. SBT349]|uniref:FtsB family cell division protein n=1 Tax=Streptomyces sp. SBT349 TaxID=1580539 RepID=UPI00066D4074
MSPRRSLGPFTQARLTRLAGLVPTRSSSAARTPFVLLIVLLLGAGMLALLFLNASLNQGSFELSELRKETRELTDEQQELQAEVDGYSAPDALAERARELGLVPAGPPAFLGPDGSVLGDPQPAPSSAPTADPRGDGQNGENGTGGLDGDGAAPGGSEERPEIAPQSGGAGRPVSPSPEPPASPSGEPSPGEASAPPSA